MTPLNRVAVAVSASVLAHAGLLAIWLHVSVTRTDAAPHSPLAAAHRLRVQMLGSHLVERSPAPATPAAPRTSAGAEMRAPASVGALRPSHDDEAAPAGSAPPETVASGGGEENQTQPGAAPEGSGPVAEGPPGEATPPFDTSAVLARLEQAALRCYPERAKRYGLRGETRVSFCLSGAATTEHVAVASSSGSGALDAAATDCVLPGAQPFPHEAAGRCFTVPVVFGRTVR